MKLLLFSDLHCDEDAAQGLVDRAGEFDVVVGAGDFGKCRKGIEITINILRQITVPTVVVPGNAESVEELTAACTGWESCHVLHGNGATISGIPFFGVGGGIPVTPFGAWSYDFTEEEATKLLGECPTGAVLVSHSPPKGALDTDSSGKSFGSTAVREAIFKQSPLLVVCGHVHDCWNQEARVGRSPVINAGPRGMEHTLIKNQPST